MNILLTGGMGYIGSHTALLLANAGHQVHIYDNLCNSNIGTLDRVQKICSKTIGFTEGDVRDTEKLTKVLRDAKIGAQHLSHHHGVRPAAVRHHGCAIQKARA